MFVAGMIIHWGGPKDKIPPGWRECDGSPLSQTEFATLYAVIGDAFGASPTDGNFYLPDLRGLFVRGVDDKAGVDPDLADRHDMQNPLLAYSGVGSVQACALESHTHTYSKPISSDSGTIDNAKAYILADTESGTPGGATVSQNETRPINAALYYIINVGIAA